MIQQIGPAKMSNKKKSRCIDSSAVNIIAVDGSLWPPHCISLSITWDVEVAVVNRPSRVYSSVPYVIPSLPRAQYI